MTQMRGHYRNGFNKRNEEYKEEYDDYKEDDIEDETDNEEKVEEQKPKEEELEFLKIREKLKEKFRHKLKKQSAHYFGPSFQDRKRTTTDNFGSFFGPSQPAIASRVLDESRSIRETQHITSKVSSSCFVREGVSAFASSERKFYKNHQLPKDNDEVKRKAQTLKDMRDYSFLFSDDADFPDKDPPLAARHVSGPKHGAGASQTPLEGKILVNRPFKSVNNGHELKNAVPASRHLQTKVPMKIAQVSRRIPSSTEPRTLSGRYGGESGPGRPVEPKPVLSKVPLQPKVSLQSKVDGQVMCSKKPNSKAVNGLSSKKDLSTSKPYSSTQNHSVEKKRASQAADRVSPAPRPAPRQAPPLKSQPPKTIPSRDIRDERQKKRPVKRKSDEEDDADAIQMIRNMFRYNPSKYTGMDDDDSDMEAGFSQILQEERRSAQIARKEDEEQLLLIEQEERRERMRKKQKLNRR